MILKFKCWQNIYLSLTTFSAYANTQLQQIQQMLTTAFLMGAKQYNFQPIQWRNLIVFFNIKFSQETFLAKIISIRPIPTIFCILDWKIVKKRLIFGFPFTYKFFNHSDWLISLPNCFRIKLLLFSSFYLYFPYQYSVCQIYLQYLYIQHILRNTSYLYHWIWLVTAKMWNKYFTNWKKEYAKFLGFAQI